MSNYLEKFEKMRIAGSLASKTLDMITDYVKEGTATNHIDKLCYEFIRDNGGYSAPQFYRGFEKSICTSLNHVVCHGIPGDRTLQDGDIVNIDVTAIVDDHYGDTSRMYTVGEISVKSKKLINVTYESLNKAIKILKPGKRIGDIGHEIQSFVEKNGFSVVRDFCGHGIGTNFHQEPNILHYGSKDTGDELKPGVKLGDIGNEIQTYVESKGFSVVRDFCGHGISNVFHEHPNILHYGKKNTGIELESGMTFTIEPMINAGKYDVKILNDGWTAVTKDKSLSAQFEHTIGITENGYEIFTKSDKNYSRPPYK